MIENPGVLLNVRRAYFMSRPKLVSVKKELCAQSARTPVGRNPSTVFKSVKRRIERALFHFEYVFGGALNDLRDGVSMRVSADQCPKVHHVQSALEHLAVGLSFLGHPSLHSNIHGKVLLDKLWNGQSAK